MRYTQTMSKTPEQQEVLNLIWHKMHERAGDSAGAAEAAQLYRQKESPDTEMALELAAMEFVTSGAAAVKSKTFDQALPFFSQAARVAQETFPLGRNSGLAIDRGNAWDRVYGDQSAQLAMLRNYFHVVRRLERVVDNQTFTIYSQSLWQTLLSLTQEFQDEASILMLQIEHDIYATAKQTFDTFVEESEQSSAFDASRVITIASRMLNRSLQEKDYDVTLRAFTVALNALRQDAKKLSHFGRQIASNVRADKNIRERQKLESWRESAKRVDTAVIQALTQLQYVGLGDDRVREIEK